MHIVVCIKQVPDTKNVRIDPDTHTLVRQGVESIINPFDLFAIEAALKIKDERPQDRVTAITMGPPQASEALRDTISRGVDDAVLLSDRAFAGSDTWATSTTLSAAIRTMGDVSLVICGKQAVDGDTGQVGPETAALLDIPYATFVKQVRFEGESIIATRQTDEGVEVWKLPMPALFTVIKEMGEPRLPSMRHKMRAAKAQIPVWGAVDIGLDPNSVGLCGSFTQVVRVFSPPRRTDRILIEGSPEEQAQQLFDYLKVSRVPGL